VRFSPDSRFIATSSFDGVVKVWDATTGKLLHTIGSIHEPVYFAAWNPTNNTFVAKSITWEVGVWSAETGALVCKLNNIAIKEKFDENLTFLYSPDGKMLLTKARNVAGICSFLPFGIKRRSVAHLWDAQTGSLIASLRDNKARPGEFYDDDEFFWGSAGDFLIIAGASVKMWDRRGKLMQELAGNALENAALSPDGKLLAITGGEPNTIASVYGMMAKLLIGKLPKDDAITTYVWQIEGAHR
jgi:WD40 repeat protein